MNINDLSTQILQMENTLHNFRQENVHRSDFYETGNSDNINQLDQLYINTYNQVNDLKNFSGFRKAPLVIQKLNNLRTYLTNLDELDNELIQRVRERGNINFGLHKQVTVQFQTLNSLFIQNRPGEMEGMISEMELLLNDYLATPSLIKSQLFKEQAWGGLPVPFKITFSP